MHVLEWRSDAAARTRSAAMLPATVLLVTALLIGCAGNREKPTKPRRLSLDSVTLVMAADVNDNWPVAVELVRVADADLLRQLLVIESSGWFDGEGDKFRSANPRELFDIWEVVPGTVVGPISVKARKRVAGVLFCDLRGRVPQRVEHQGSIVVRIEDEGCKIGTAPPRRRWPTSILGWLRGGG